MSKDWCTYSPDVVLGVDISLSCRGHDGLYEKGDNKFSADIALFLDVWAVAELADDYKKTVGIRAYAVVQYIFVSVFGWYFWYKPKVATCAAKKLKQFKNLMENMKWLYPQ